MLLSNRELAIIFWIILAAIFLFRKSEIRHSLKLVLLALIAPFVVFMTLALLVWIVLGVFLFKNFYDLSISDYKAIFYWTLFSALASVYFINKKASNINIIVFWIKESFSVIILVSFIVNFHVFPIYIELMLQPSLFIVAATMAFSSERKEYEPAFNLLLGLLVATLIVLSFVSIKGLVDDPIAASQHLFSTIVVPLLLSIYFLPFLVVFNAILVVDVHVKRLKKFHIIENLSFSILFHLFVYFGFSLRCFDRWCRFVMLHRPKSTEDVIATIVEVSRNIRDQSEWRLQYCSGGWSPVDLMRALSDFSIYVSSYDRHILDWYGESGPFYPDKIRCANFVKYSISGDRRCVKNIVLELNVLDADSSKEMAEFFSKIVEIVTNKVSSESIELVGDNFCIQLDNVMLTVSTFYSGKALLQNSDLEGFTL